MNIEQTLKERAKEAETTVVSYLPEVTGYPKTVLEAMEYSVEAGGKRIRPVLMREVYHMCGGTEDSLIAPFMAAIEMIHTYSLVRFRHLRQPRQKIWHRRQRHYASLPEKPESMAWLEARLWMWKKMEILSMKTCYYMFMQIKHLRF